MSGTSSAGSFSHRALEFFDGLEEDNSREYWTRQADAFDREVRAPMAALLESLPPAYQPFRIFRMNRDLRFSNDKSPYKLQHSGIHEAGGIGHYVQIGAAGLLAASGMYWMARDQLERYRAAVDDARQGAALQRLLARAGGVVSTEGMGLQSLKTAPRGYSRDHPRIDLLRRKGLAAHSVLAGGDLCDADAEATREFVLAVFDAAEPLNAWLRRHVGPAVIAEPD
jgi:uncharacterized protein (TIGR02453 family)